MPLDPDSRAFLEARQRAGIEPVSLKALAKMRAEREIWRRRVAAPTVSVFETRDIAIPVNGGEIGVRLYRPDSGRHPAIMFFHGGGWVLGDLEHGDGLCRRLCRLTGCAVINVDYRLAPEHPFPTAFEDGLAAFDWLTREPPEGVDPARIAVAGSSAGGNLAAAVALKCRDRGGSQPVVQLLVYPVLDDACDAPSYHDYGEGYVVSAADMRWYWAQYLQKADDNASPYACPLKADDLSGLPATLVITAECDPVRDDGERYAGRLIETGLEATLSRYDGVLHTFLAQEGKIAKAAVAVDEAARFLCHHLLET